MKNSEALYFPHRPGGATKIARGRLKSEWHEARGRAWKEARAMTPTAAFRQPYYFRRSSMHIIGLVGTYAYRLQRSTAVGVVYNA